jgi:hypothetical protein
MRYPGAAWQPVASGTSSQIVDLAGIAATDAYAAIRNPFATQVLRCDQAGCGVITVTDSSGQTLGIAQAVWENSPDDVFLGTGGHVAHYDGTGYWSVIGPPASMYVDVLDLWSPAPNQVYAVGIGANGGWSIVHYDGATWTTELSSSSTFDAMRSIWGSGPTDVFAVGSTGADASLLFHRDGTRWVAMPNPSTHGLRGVHGRAADDVYAVGDGGTILHYNGVAWTAMASGTTASLRAIWVRGPDDVFAVGQGGTILHLDSVGWSPVRSNTTATLNSVWGSGSTTFFAGDNGTFLALVQTTPL